MENRVRTATAEAILYFEVRVEPPAPLLTEIKKQTDHIHKVGNVQLVICCSYTPQTHLLPYVSSASAQNSVVLNKQSLQHCWTLIDASTYPFIRL